MARKPRKKKYRPLEELVAVYSLDEWIEHCLSDGSDPAAVSTVLQCRFSRVMEVRNICQQKKLLQKNQTAAAEMRIPPGQDRVSHDDLLKNAAAVRRETLAFMQSGGPANAQDHPRGRGRPANVKRLPLVACIQPRHYGYSKGLDN